MRTKLRSSIGFILSIGLLSACSSGERGNEGPEGAEGPEGGGGTPSNVPFVSNGLSRGTFESIVLAPDESFSGLLNDTEISMVYDPLNEVFRGRVKNEAATAVCDLTVTAMLDGFMPVNTTLSGNSLMIGLTAGGGQAFEFFAPSVMFNQWTVVTESFSCSSAPTSTPGGGEGAEGPEGGGSEGPEAGGGSEGPEGPEPGGGAESGDEASPPIPINQPFSGVFQNQQFDFAFDPLTSAFRGTVENVTSAFVCESRTEIHLGFGTAVVELGPTIPENLSPGEIRKIVIWPDGRLADTYTLHPEATPCP